MILSTCPNLSAPFVGCSGVLARSNGHSPDPGNHFVYRCLEVPPGSQDPTRLLAHRAIDLPRDVAANGANLAYDLGDGRRTAAEDSESTVVGNLRTPSLE